MKTRLTLAALAALALTWAVPGYAVGRLADVTVTDRASGTVLPMHYYRGEYWVAGVPGAAYAIHIRNASGQRVLAVASVDGVNVVSGETASVTQSGYVFNAWQGYEITGWRKSDSDVAAFEFTASPNSYAERTGRPRDVGVIGVALFTEKRVYVPQPYPEISRVKPGYGWPNASRAESSRGEAQDAASAVPAPAAPAAPAAQANSIEESSNGALRKDKAASAKSEADYAGRAQSMPQPAPKLGTGHGARESSVVSRTEFERAQNSPNEVVRIRYDSYQNLVSQGVIRPYHPLPQRPNPFPDSAVGYAPDPPAWR
jgi:hypothetical protein